MPALDQQLRRLMSRETSQSYGLMLLLGSICAEERIAYFLLNLSYPMHRHGYSRFALILRMTRLEIGSLLGIKIETVSRTQSALQRKGIISINGKEIEILDLDMRKAILPFADDSLRSWIEGFGARATPHLVSAAVPSPRVAAPRLAAPRLANHAAG